MSDPWLESPGPAEDWDFEVWVKPPLTRGQRVGDEIPLTKLENVGGMKVLPSDRPAWMGEIPVTRSALLMLEVDPFSGTWGTLPPDSAFFRRHLSGMMTDGVLEAVAVEEVTGGGRYSAILKDLFPPGARAIFDLRNTNKEAADVEQRFSLLGIDAFIAELRFLGNVSEKRFRCLHADVRNCYYQMGIGRLLGNACCLRFGDVYLRPRVLPMGYKHACLITQSIVWNIVLHRGPEGNLGVPEAVYGLTDAPSHIRLEGGGLVVLVYDSILIIAPDEECEKWEQRLKRNCEEVNCLLKYITREGMQADFVFCGVRIMQDRNGLWWSTDLKKVEEWMLVVNQEGLKPTPRNFFGLVGIVRFVAPILGWEPRVLGEMTKCQSDLGEVTDWDARSVPVESMDLVKAMVRRIPEAAKQRQHCRSHYPKRGRVPPMYIAVDATLTHWAAWVMEDGRVIVSKSKQGVFYPPVKRIGVGEARCIEEAIIIANGEGASMLVVASDNKEAGPVMAKGHGVDDMQVVIRRTVFQGTLVVGDIGTDFNVADIGTRPTVGYSEADVVKRTGASWACLKNAMAKYLAHRKYYFPREAGWMDVRPGGPEVAPDKETM